MIHKGDDEIISKMFMLPNLRLNTPLHVVAETGKRKVFKVRIYNNIKFLVVGRPLSLKCGIN